jgi:hypothetical protein
MSRNYLKLEDISVPCWGPNKDLKLDSLKMIVLERGMHFDREVIFPICSHKEPVSQESNESCLAFKDKKVKCFYAELKNKKLKSYFELIKQ